MHQQRDVPDFGGVKSAELSPWAQRECMNTEWCRAEPTGKEVHQQRVVPDFGGVKSAELSPRAERECINKEWCQTLVGLRVQNRAHGQSGSA